MLEVVSLPFLKAKKTLAVSFFFNIIYKKFPFFNLQTRREKKKGPDLFDLRPSKILWVHQPEPVTPPQLDRFHWNTGRLINRDPVGSLIIVDEIIPT